MDQTGFLVNQGLFLIELASVLLKIACINRMEI